MCKNTNECPAGQKCSGGVCTATARGLRAIILCVIVGFVVSVMLARVGHAEESTGRPESFKKTTAKIICEEACDAAAANLSSAQSACSSANASCSASKKTAAASCDKGCTDTKERALGVCEEQDEAVINSCVSAALTAMDFCSRGCRNADSHTSECSAVAASCKPAGPAQTAKNKACKC